MGIETAFRGLARNMVGTFGKQTEITIRGPSSYDPSTRSASAPRTETTLKGVIGQYDARQIQGHVQANDFPVWVDAISVERPAPGDEITVDSETYNVVAVRTTYAGSRPALYELQVRQ